MSISVKNISVSIDGIKSNEFDIELEGITWHLDNFSLYQSLLSPNSLSFSMHKDPKEDDIRENIFGICGYIIGKEITLSLQTEIITPNEAGDKTSIINYKGVIYSYDEKEGLRRFTGALWNDVPAAALLVVFIASRDRETGVFTMGVVVFASGFTVRLARPAFTIFALDAVDRGIFGNVT